jgi:hypothetical protein
VCYCLGITAVDPARHALLFERFISEDRNEPPDIDVDFEHERREEVIQYIYEQVWPPPRRAVRHGDPLSPAHGDPRGGKGDGPFRRRDFGARPHGLGQLRPRDGRRKHMLPKPAWIFPIRTCGGF